MIKTTRDEYTGLEYIKISDYYSDKLANIRTYERDLTINATIKFILTEANNSLSSYDVFKSITDNEPIGPYKVELKYLTIQYLDHFNYISNLDDYKFICTKYNITLNNLDEIMTDISYDTDNENLGTIHKLDNMIFGTDFEYSKKDTINTIIDNAFYVYYVRLTFVYYLERLIEITNMKSKTIINDHNIAGYAAVEKEVGRIVRDEVNYCKMNDPLINMWMTFDNITPYTIYDVIIKKYPENSKVRQLSLDDLV